MVVYVLKLKNDNFYVGQTVNLERRLKEHILGFGSEWTKKHGNVSLFQTYENDDPFYEDMIVKKMMKQHGIHKVRGGSYSQIILPKEKIAMIENELRGASNLCFKCGGNHFVRSCTQSSRPSHIVPLTLNKRSCTVKQKKQIFRRVLFM